MSKQRLVLSIDGTGHDYSMERLPITIGRNHENDIVLAYSFVSGRHGRIFFDNGDIVYQDLESTNGTFVDNEFICGSSRSLCETGSLVFGKKEVVEVAYRIADDQLQLNDTEQSLFQQGYKNLKQGNYKQALACFEQILSETPKSPAIYCYAGFAASQLDEIDTAILRFEQYLTLMPRDVKAMVDLGKLYERKGQMKRASARYHKALEHKPGDHEITSRLRNLNRYEPVSETFKAMKSTEEILGADLTDTVSTRHFQVTYNIARHGRRLNDVLKILEETYLSVGDHLDIYPIEKVPVMLRTQEETLTHSSGDAVGTGDKRGIWAMITPRTMQEAPFLKVLLIHEYVHYLIDSNIPDGVHLSWWIHEGLAQYESQNMRANDESLMAQMALNEAFIPLEMLDTGIHDDGVEGLIQLAYAQAYSLVEFIISRYGWKKISVLMKAVSQGRQGSAFAEAGIDYAVLEDNWRKWLDIRLSGGPAGRTVHLS